MKTLNEYLLLEKEEDRSWNLWDYRENGVHEILIWKNSTPEVPEQSDITEIDKDGIELMNTSFDEIKSYIEKHKNDKVDKFHLDFSNAKLDKINSIF